MQIGEEHYVGHAFCLQRLGMEAKARKRLLHAISAYNYRIEIEESSFHARLNRALVLFLLGREHLAECELDDLVDLDAEYGGMMVSALRQAMEKARNGDRWSILGLDD